MQQVLIKKGTAYIDDIPAPTCGDNEILVNVKYSLISTGTEMASVTGSGKNLLQRAKEQPDNLALVMDMIKKQGFAKTYKLVKNVIEMGLPTGYSAAGEVIEVGKNINNFQKGDRVACAGAGKANHAEIIAVPKNLVVKIPDNVTFADASSVTLGAIALQGIRQADPKLGDNVVVMGLGLLGLLSVQMLKANGCNVIGTDFDEKRLKTAKEFGCDLTISAQEDVAAKIMQATNGYGADKIIITAASASDGPINQAMQVVRKKGTVVVVGAVGLGLKRSPFYEKEVDLKISCSYGPGRYDPTYEEKGQDYPYGYVRWTENRNMSQYLKLISDQKLNFKKIAEKEFVINEADKAYDDLKTSEDKPLAVLLKYPELKKKPETLVKLEHKLNAKNFKDQINVAIIGAGGFASGMHLPNLEKLDKYYKIKAIIDKNGVTAKQVAQKYEAPHATTDYRELLKNKDIDLFIITTRHDLHYQIAKDILEAGKAVFCEKPMALTNDELNNLVKIINKTGGFYTVGFNRRFSPLSKKIKKAVEKKQNPLMIHYRMNAGYIPLDHWVHNEEGGGRIIGEGCHILDLFSYLTDSKPLEITTEKINPTTDYYSSSDNQFITVKYADGSVCNLLYTALGNKDISKEYMEVYYDGNTIIMDDYKTLTGYGVSLNETLSLTDKGHYQELIEVAESMKNGTLPIELDSLISTTRLSFME